MATVINLPADPRLQAIDKGVGSGVDNFFAVRKKRDIEKKFMDAYRQVDSSLTYEEAVANIAKVDPEILANPQALEQLSKHIDQKFPATEPLQVMDQNRNLQTITHRKGSPPSSQELATKGYTLPADTGVGSFFTFDEKTGDIGVEDKSTRDEVVARNPTRLVVSKEEVGSTTSLMNAFTNAREAQAKMMDARNTSDATRRPTQFEQEVTAIQDRLGLEDRNTAVRVYSDKATAIKLFQPKFAKVTQSGEMAFTDDAQRGHVVNAETLAEPIVVAGVGPEQAAQIMAIDAYYNTAKDAVIASDDDIKLRAQRDFMRLTGLQAGDATLKELARVAEEQVPEGEARDIEAKSPDGKTLMTIRFGRFGGRLVPLKRIN